MKKRICLFTFLFYALLLVVSCNTQQLTIDVSVKSTLVEKETTIATATSSVLWSTTTPELLNVYEDGKIEALKEGTAILRATLSSNTSITKDITIIISKAIDIEEITIKLPTRVSINTKVPLKATITPSNASFPELKWETNDEQNAIITEDNHLEFKKSGTYTVTATSINNPSINTSCEIIAYVPYTKINISGKTLVDLEETPTYTLSTIPSNATGKIMWSTSDDAIATISEDGILSPLQEGIIQVIATSVDNPDVYGEITVEIDYFERYMNIISETDTVEIGETIYLYSQMMPHGATVQTVWISSDPSIAKINSSGYLQGLKEGEVTITANAMVNGSITGSKTFYVVTPDETAPVIEVEEPDVTISAGETFDPLTNVTAIDNRDGDITSNITVEGTVNNIVRGTYEIILSVSDKKGNSTSVKRNITVVWDHDLEFIGHAGCYYGIMNTEEAFLNAATKQGYTAIECDIRVTKDGVFVVCHDETFAGIQISSTNWADLKDVTETKTRGGKTYTSTICTLEKFLDICYTYDISPVIELKYNPGINNNDCSKLPALMNLVKEKKLDDKVIFLGSQIECLKWFRNNGYDNVKLQYLVSSCAASETLNTCVAYNLDISFSISNNSNTEEWIKKYQKHGLEVSCYTFSQYQTKIDLIKWVKMGVDYVTCDVLTIKDCYITLQNMKNEGTTNE